MNFVEKVLSVVANFVSESTSLIGYYEPKVPQKLIKPEKEEK